MKTTAREICIPGISVVPDAEYLAAEPNEPC